MSSINGIPVEKLVRLIGVPHSPALIDVRLEEDFAADPRLIPGAVRRPYQTAPSWAPEFAGRSTVVICERGHKLSEGAAAWLRNVGASSAEVLLGGHAAWVEEGLPLVPESKLPPRDPQGRTVWVTRERPKIDRIACPWLIHRFVDPLAVFLFVAPSEVVGVSERFNGAPFDIEGVFWSHRGEKCTFDVMVEELGLATAPLLRLATLVRGADTARLDLGGRRAARRLAWVVAHVCGRPCSASGGHPPL
jgi:rhodanese-related sulfurtransferase